MCGGCGYRRKQAPLVCHLPRHTTPPCACQIMKYPAKSLPPFCSFYCPSSYRNGGCWFFDTSSCLAGWPNLPAEPAAKRYYHAELAWYFHMLLKPVLRYGLPGGCQAAGSWQRPQVANWLAGWLTKYSANWPAPPLAPPAIETPWRLPAPCCRRRARHATASRRHCGTDRRLLW